MPPDRLGPADLPELVALAATRHAAAGGLAHTATAAFLRSRYLDEVTWTGAVRETDRLVGAAALRPARAGGHLLALLVQPDRPTAGDAAALLDRGLAAAPGPV